ncbi:MAG TPA: OmpA family protein [Cytophagaceae bacterium]|jgi:outer membrane protein OmpA-like peptidoglycan-associated protein|nr:OmpA family protein [Cytophagaceae bacterium]
MKYLAAFVFLIFISAHADAQFVKQKKLEIEADGYYELKDYLLAQHIYEKLDSLNPGQGKYLYRIGVCYYNSHHKVKCLPYFLRCNELKYPEADLDFYIARGFHLNHDFDEAIKHYSTYKNSATITDSSRQELERLIGMCETGKELVADSLELIIENIGPAINTRYPDYVPVISADETVLIFTSRRPGSTGNQIDPEDGMFHEDIYISTKDSSGKWGKPEDMGSHINTDYHDACVGLSSDGRELFIYRSGESRTNRGDIYQSKLSGTTWSEPERLGGHINSDSWEPSATTTTDEKTIIFSSDRPGGFGGIDLYIVRLEPNGQWSEPKNMGSVINTKFDEDAPFIFSDNRTLYFSSRGHKTMGGFDIFKSSFDLEKSEYLDPVNVGYPINTADDDIYFVWNAKGERGYFSSWRNDSYGEKDIYIIHRPKENLKMMVMKGNIFDQGTNTPLGAVIFLVNPENNDTIGIYNSNQSSGKYSIKVEHGKKYSVIVQSKGYNYRQELIAVADDKTLFSFKKDFYLDQLKVGSAIVLNNIFFDFDRATLRNESQRELEILYNFLKDHPKLKVEIGGHTDNFGGDNYNKKLSQKRAVAIVKNLVAKGIDKKRLIAKGYGEDTPVASNDNPEGRQLNRRTELKLLDSNYRKVDAIENIDIQYKSQYIKGNDDDNSLDRSLNTAGKNDNVVAKKIDKIDFIYSEENKPAVGTKLKSQVNFIENRTKALTLYSRKKLMNIVEAMKAYPAMKIAIVTYSDSSVISMKLAEKRFISIREMLISKGIEKKRLESRTLNGEAKDTKSRLSRIDFVVLGY